MFNYRQKLIAKHTQFFNQVLDIGFAEIPNKYLTNQEVIGIDLQEIPKPENYSKIIVGARPNIVKIAPLMDSLNFSKRIQSKLIHTGQHYDIKMSELFFNQLGIQLPDINLNIGSDTQAKQVAKIMMSFEDVCIKEKPDAILVVGDVNSTLACSLVASKLQIKIIHVEAGLRSFDKAMPEEINRIVTDSLADILMTPSEDANINLLKEGVCKEKIFFVGNIMIDTLYKFLPLIHKSDILKQIDLKKNNFILVTLHRPDNVDNIQNFRIILETLNTISHKYKIVFPIHPRTKKNISHFGLSKLTKNLIITEPLGYFEFQNLICNSRLVITDSGGIQEETTVYQVPCITIRKNTERPVTLSEGTNELIGLNMNKLLKYTDRAFNNDWKPAKIPELWDGKTSQRCVKIIEKIKFH
ncbi:MAG TPA: UDP-N-acetylglucosamine 2-epimerase (non-hydrolyzing) [Bacteroidales bacterium]|nr:UDP-N-acetylglucosamine 2-epimerase (non-hydrolyzing) [Bacteroidales bacterium]